MTFLTANYHLDLWSICVHVEGYTLTERRYYSTPALLSAVFNIVCMRYLVQIPGHCMPYVCACMCMCVCLCMCMYVHVCVGMCVCMRACVHAYVDVSVCAGVYVFVHAK